MELKDKSMKQLKGLCKDFEITHDDVRKHGHLGKKTSWVKTIEAHVRRNGFSQTSITMGMTVRAHLSRSRGYRLIVYDSAGDEMIKYNRRSASLEPITRMLASIENEGAKLKVEVRGAKLLEEFKAAMKVEVSAKEIPKGKRGWKSAPIGAVAGVHSNLKIFTQLADLAGMNDILLEDKPRMIVFIPADEAFAEIPEEMMTSIASDNDLLESILKNHIVELTPAHRSGFGATILNDNLLTIGGGKIQIQESDIIEGDIIATNGTIHIINRVLIPDSAGFDIMPSRATRKNPSCYCINPSCGTCTSNPNQEMYMGIVENPFAVIRRNSKAKKIGAIAKKVAAHPITHEVAGMAHEALKKKAKPTRNGQVKALLFDYIEAVSDSEEQMEKMFSDLEEGTLQLPPINTMQKTVENYRKTVGEHMEDAAPPTRDYIPKPPMNNPHDAHGWKPQSPPQKGNFTDYPHASFESAEIEINLPGNRNPRKLKIVKHHDKNDPEKCGWTASYNDATYGRQEAQSSITSKWASQALTQWGYDNSWFTQADKDFLYDIGLWPSSSEGSKQPSYHHVRESDGWSMYSNSPHWQYAWDWITEQPETRRNAATRMPAPLKDEDWHGMFATHQEPGMIEFESDTMEGSLFFDGSESNQFGGTFYFGERKKGPLPIDYNGLSEIEAADWLCKSGFRYSELQQSEDSTGWQAVIIIEDMPNITRRNAVTRMPAELKAENWWEDYEWSSFAFGILEGFENIPNRFEAVEGATARTIKLDVEQWQDARVEFELKRLRVHTYDGVSQNQWIGVEDYKTKWELDDGVWMPVLYHGDDPSPEAVEFARNALSRMYLYDDVQAIRDTLLRRNPKRDSCCCGATIEKPCKCMNEGVMQCSSTEPMCPCYAAKQPSRRNPRKNFYPALKAAADLDLDKYIRMPQEKAIAAIEKKYGGDSKALKLYLKAVKLQMKTTEKTMDAVRAMPVRNPKTTRLTIPKDKGTYGADDVAAEIGSGYYVLQDWESYGEAVFVDNNTGMRVIVKPAVGYVIADAEEGNSELFIYSEDDEMLEFMRNPRRNPMPHGKSFMEWAKEEDKAHPDESFINWASDEAHEYKQQVKYGTEKARDYAASRPREAEKKAKAAVRGFEQWISSEIDEAAHTRRNPAHTFASFCSEAKKGTAQRKKLAKKHNAPLSIVEEINKYANKLGGSDDVNVAQELFEGWCI